MDLKDFQSRVLETFGKYLEHLRTKFDAVTQAKEALAAANISAVAIDLDYASQAWTACQEAGLLPRSRALKEHSNYSPRKDGTGAVVPSVCFKIPTGGGKTLLGVWSTSAVLHKYLRVSRGFILWIVPNEAIYAQTKKQLMDRDHPYRQTLDRIAAAPDRVKIMEKEDPLSAQDVSDYLCVMLLMLQSANRQTKETLRIFRDRGNVNGFFPHEGDAIAHHSLLQSIPNLDYYGASPQVGAIIKASLGNVLRSIRPVVVLDEGHKAYSQLAFETLYGFNPAFVLELSATPPLEANRLVDVSGADLEREEMIKLPINVHVSPGSDWRVCLRESWEKLEDLHRSAQRFQSNSGRYIRPILLVQVERTGREQRDPKYVHALDVRDYLERLGLRNDEIAIKSAEVNELSVAENENLLSPSSPVRVVITKQALQEGWDCPFAYVLCSLAASKSLKAMTQIVGRILRQPHAKKTHTAALDESYVFCHHTSTANVVEGVKTALEQQGMGDLASSIRLTDSTSPPARSLSRRKGFGKIQIFLPQVIWASDKTARELDYERDILAALDWDSIDVKKLTDAITPGTHRQAATVVRVGLDILAGADRKLLSPEVIEEESTFDSVYAARAVSEVVSNSWTAMAIVEKALSTFRLRGYSEEAIGRESAYIRDELLKALESERDRMAEDHFKAMVRKEHIQFRLRTDQWNWAVPASIPTAQPSNGKLLYRSSDAHPVQKSLFAPMYAGDFDQLEAEFACYLDEDKALKWWFRNIARQAYGLQGWRRHKVYPDFIFALQKSASGNNLVVLETKGDQLGGHDTIYKSGLLDLLSQNYVFGNEKSFGNLEVVVDSTTTVKCGLVFGSEWKNKLTATYLAK